MPTISNQPYQFSTSLLVKDKYFVFIDFRRIQFQRQGRFWRCPKSCCRPFRVCTKCEIRFVIDIKRANIDAKFLPKCTRGSAVYRLGNDLQSSITMVMGQPPWKPSQDPLLEIGGRKWSNSGIKFGLRGVNY